MPIALVIVGVVIAGLMVGATQLDHLGEWLLERGTTAADQQQWRRARAEFERAAQAFHLHGDDLRRAETLRQLGRCWRPDRDPDRGDWRRAAATLGQAARLAARHSDDRLTALAVRDQAYCLQRDHNPRGGDWGRALRLYERAAYLFAELGDPRQQRAALHGMAWCLTPNDANPAGDLDRATALYARAVDVGRHPDVPAGDLAESLHQLGWCYRSAKDPDVQRASRCLREAAQLSDQAGQHREHADSLRELAECRVHARHPQRDLGASYEMFCRAAAEFGAAGAKLEQARTLARAAYWQMPGHNPEGSWRRVIEHYEAAAKLLQEDGSLNEEAHIQHWLAWSLQPDRNPESGDWPRAAKAYARAAALYEELGGAEMQARCLVDQGFCLARGERQSMDAAARYVMQRGLHILREVGAGEDADRWAPWVER
ncbi:MAG: hypothetical protein AAF628_22020 [Planctomycetota bacterium]